MMTVMTADTSEDRSLDQLREEYESLAGLRLTLSQVARLLDVDQEQAKHLLERLETEGLLLEAAGGIYRRSAPLFA
jgi:Mn-dependent DtxR family transcriptional regulator